MTLRVTSARHGGSPACDVGGPLRRAASSYSGLPSAASDASHFGLSGRQRRSSRVAVKGRDKRICGKYLISPMTFSWAHASVGPGWWLVVPPTDCRGPCRPVWGAAWGLPRSQLGLGPATGSSRNATSLMRKAWRLSRLRRRRPRVGRLVIFCTPNWRERGWPALMLPSRRIRTRPPHSQADGRIVSDLKDACLSSGQK